MNIYTPTKVVSGFFVFLLSICYLQITLTRSVRQQGEKARPLDCLGELSLMLGAEAGAFAR